MHRKVMELVCEELALCIQNETVSFAPFRSRSRRFRCRNTDLSHLLDYIVELFNDSRLITDYFLLLDDAVEKVLILTDQIGQLR